MKIETIENILNFLEKKGEHRIPLKFKLLNNIPLTEEDVYVRSGLDL